RPGRAPYKKATTPRSAWRIFPWRGSCKQQYPVRRLRRRGPHLAAMHDIGPAVPFGARRNRRRVEARIRLRHTEAAAVLAPDERRQIAGLLFLRAEDGERHRPEQVDMDGGRTRETGARLRD